MAGPRTVDTARVHVVSTIETTRISATTKGTAAMKMNREFAAMKEWMNREFNAALLMITTGKRKQRVAGRFIWMACSGSPA